ncbi:STM4015 family protein [Verrucomicrobium sp. BvORR106]|uniref:STM4015 family protein n=1 Tax=Verrucomicrobium sp. BvORR106 TaxID=1403819 RepID=UPI00056E0385|nr:STM4015 family protein [Verrucomicrobium sp. BvORR106]
MSRHEHATNWLGLPVRIFDEEASEKGIQDYKGAIYRLVRDWDTEISMEELFARFVANPACKDTTGIIIGAWAGDDPSNNSEGIVQLLVSSRHALPNLKGIFLGDILSEENEISWIEQSDVSPLFAAYPELEHFRVRGGNGLSFGEGVRHDYLKSLTVETGGMSQALLQQIVKSQFLCLEHLEVWTGSDGYGWDGSLADLLPVLEGRLLPTLKHLGVRNSEIANEVAQTLASSPLLSRIQSLDLSLGVLRDEGAQALLDSPAVASLKALDLHHNFLSEAMCKSLERKFPGVNVEEQQKPDEWKGEISYYVAVGE